MAPIQDLKLKRKYGGFLFLAEDARGIPWLNPHRHEALELNLVVKGSVTYVIGKSRHTFKAGELFWLFPSQIHQAVERTPDSQYYVASFTPELLRKNVKTNRHKALLRKSPPDQITLHCMLSPSNLNQACQLMHAILKDGGDADILNREAGFGLSPGFRYEHRDSDFLNAVLAHVLLFCWKLQLEAEKPNPPAKLHPSVLKAITLFREGTAPDSLKELGRLSGASPTYLSRIFKAQLGVSLTEYKNSMRLDRACQLHKSSMRHMTLSELAYESGFKSYAQFYKLCRSRYGMDPKALFKNQSFES